MTDPLDFPIGSISTYSEAPSRIRPSTPPTARLGRFLPFGAAKSAKVETRPTDELEARVIAHDRGWTMVGGSDSHSVFGIGAAVSSFPRLPDDEQDLAALIRVGALRPERTE